MKKYETPELELSRLEALDIITVSVGLDDYIGDIDPTNPDNGLTWGQL